MGTLSDFWDETQGVFVKGGKPDVGNIGAGLAGLYALSRTDDSGTLSKFFGGSSQPTGYQGGIPNYIASREAVPGAFASTTPRRPGEAGQRYFTDTSYAVNTGSPIMGKTAEQLAAQNAKYLADKKLADEILGTIGGSFAATGTPAPTPAPAPKLRTKAGFTNETGNAAQDTSWLTKSRDFDDTQWKKVIDTWAQQNPYATPAEVNVAFSKFGVPTHLRDYLGKYGYARGGLTTLPPKDTRGSPDWKANWLDTGVLPERFANRVTREQARSERSSRPSTAQWMTDPSSVSPAVWQQVANAWKSNHPSASSEEMAAGLGRLNVPTSYYAQGGLTSLQSPKGYYLGGPTDGMADEVPASIDGQQEAALSHGEFVFPADVVSHLGNGNSEAGAKVLYDMMDRVRKARTGTTKQGKQINPNSYTPR
jgi:hypothetical protein